MSKDNFAWHPDIGAQQKNKPTVHQTKFGDGYEARTPVGINSMPKSWSVKFTRPTVEAVAILNFLKAQSGVKAFTWTDPMDDAATYVCREWTSNQLPFGVYEVSGTFDQVFEP